MALAPRPFTINLTGDVMLGRLIDQLRPTHVSNPSDANHATHFVRSNCNLKDYSAKSPWGNTLPLFHSADLNIINLETSVTTHPKPFPNKVFNYRMHPANVDFLKEARVGYASLANNHSLDFCEEGLVETIETLEREKIALTGVGKTKEDARKPARLVLQHHSIGQVGDHHVPNSEKYEVYTYSASDHPRDWSSIPGFHLIDYSNRSRQHLRNLLNSDQTPNAALKIFSVHWGPNYSWRPSSQIKSLAHFLVDECDVDIVHGHSPHHVQGVEVYKGKLLIYGCGDFVDDYAVDESFRNDISALWRVLVVPREESGERQIKNPPETGTKLQILRLEIFPTRCKRFSTDLLEKQDPDYDWMKGKLKTLSTECGTSIKEEVGQDGRPKLTIDLNASQCQ